MNSTKEYLNNLSEAMVKEHEAQTKIMKDSDIDFINSDRWVDDLEEADNE